MDDGYLVLVLVYVDKKNGMTKSLMRTSTLFKVEKVLH